MVEAFLKTTKTEVTRSAIPQLIRHSRIQKCDLTSNLHPSLALAQQESNGFYMYRWTPKKLVKIASDQYGCFHKLGALFAGVLVIKSTTIWRAPLFFWKLPNGESTCGWFGIGLESQWLVILGYFQSLRVYFGV